VPARYAFAFFPGVITVFCVPSFIQSRVMPTEVLNLKG
jgi:hypothetical protein